MTFDYEGWLKAALKQLETLYQQKTAIESEISRLEKAIQGFAPLVKNPSKWFGPQTGLTDAIREILKHDPSRVFTATEIRDELIFRGVSLRQKNPLAAIHQILARLIDAELVKVSTHEPGRNRYKWDGEVPKPHGGLVSEEFMKAISGLSDPNKEGSSNLKILNDLMNSREGESMGDRMVRLSRQDKKK